MFSTAILMIALQGTPCDCPYESTVIHGHRGSGNSTRTNPFAENTLPSIENAFLVGAEYAEIDVHLSKDGQVVLMHDHTLEDTTDAEGCISEWTAADLQELDATVGSAAEEPAAVPLLTEAVALAKQYEGMLNIDVKVLESATQACDATDIPALVQAIVDVLDEADFREGAFISSFSFQTLEEFKRVAPDLPVGFITAHMGPDLLEQAEDVLAAGFEAVNPIFIGLTDTEVLSALQETGLELHPWTANQRQHIEDLYLAGVDGIITDRPESAFEIRAGLCEAYACPVPAEPEPASDTGFFGCAAGGAGAPPFALLLLLALLALRRRGRQAA
jgi:glycerophosphoryl diester phosphodiesterase